MSSFRVLLVWFCATAAAVGMSRGSTDTNAPTRQRASQYFGLRGRQEHHDMKVQDFELLEDDNGVQFTQYTKGPTKTRQSGLKAKVRDFQPRMFAIGGERCPVSIFLEYMNRRPVSLRNTGPFYLAINHVWFKAQPMGVNKINTIMMKSIVAGTSLEESSKKFTNHSARKTLVKKLKKDKVERSSIAKVTGHRNIQSLDDYDEKKPALLSDLSEKQPAQQVDK